LTQESSNHCLEDGGLIGLNLRCMLFLALALAGLLMPLAGCVREVGSCVGNHTDGRSDYRSDGASPLAWINCGADL
jgi:hypothetical protein